MSLKKFKNCQGIMLIEILLTVGLMSMIFLPLTLTLTTGYRTYYAESENIDVMQNGRIALDRMVENIRNSNPEDISVENHKLMIGKISYYIQGNQIKEEISGTKNEVARYVKAFEITTDLNEKGQIKMIHLTIELQRNRVKDYALTTSIYLRNK